MKVFSAQPGEQDSSEAFNSGRGSFSSHHSHINSEQKWMSLFFLNIIQLAKSFLKHCSAVSVKLTSKKGIGFASVHISGECLASSDGLNFFSEAFPPQ